MPSTRDIRRRIKSVKNIAQITKAMELVAAAKMRKAQNSATNSRPYAVLSADLLKRMSGLSEDFVHPLLERVTNHNDKADKTLIVLITSNRGLAGALNSNVINKGLEIVRTAGQESVDMITVGKKAQDAARRLKLNVAAAFDAKDKNIEILDAQPIAEIAITDFLKHKYKKVFLVYTDFVSTLVQKPNVLQLLPFVYDEPVPEKKIDVLLEPGPEHILDNLIHHAIEFSVYQALLEASASEHSARMMAMRNANDAAGELIDDLTLSYNQTRQSAITKELSEISAAKLAMEG